MKLFLSQTYPAHMIIKKDDGSYGVFFATPARKITERDIKPLRVYIEKGNNAKEAPSYMYQMYGVEKPVLN